MSLSIIIPFRAEDDRPYLLERLRNFKIYKNKNVEYILVDSGSPLKYREEIKNISNEKGMKYLFHDTEGDIFAIGKARDYGVEYATKEFVTFMDVDLVGVNNFIKKIYNQIDYEIKNYKKLFFTIPCFYLTQEGTNLFEQMDENIRDEYFFRLYLDGDKEFIQNLAPSSSVIVIRKSHYLSVGGHNPLFKGHGYEDFELVHRLLSESQHIPRSRDYYYDSKTWDSNFYRGFRSTFSLLGAKSLANKLYVYHKWHPRPSSNGYEISRFQNHVNAIELFKKFDKEKIHPTPLIDKTRKIRNVLFFGIPFSAAAECWRDAAPYLGKIIYTKEYYFKGDNGEFLQEDFEYFLKKNNIDLILFPNPYGNSLRLAIYKYVKKNNLSFYCFERGALPDSWFFDKNGFNYDSISYSESKWNKEITDEEKEDTKKYINLLFKSSISLEKQGNRIGKEALAEKLKIGNNKVLFVPMQRPSDTVIKYFTNFLSLKIKEQFNNLQWFVDRKMNLKDYNFQKKYFKYKNSVEVFLDIIDEVAKELNKKGWIVLIKQHPLETYQIKTKNCLVVPNDTNMYDLIELADAVALINSGMGVYAMMAKKPCYIFGEAFYSFKGINKEIRTFNIKEIVITIDGGYELDYDKVLRFIKYLKNDFYSFGVPYTEQRKENDGSLRTITKKIDFYKLILGEEKIFSYEKYQPMPLSLSSPLFNRFKLDMAMQKQKRQNESKNISFKDSKSNNSKSNSIIRKIRKFRNNKESFFKDSNNTIVKMIGKLFYGIK